MKYLLIIENIRGEEITILKSNSMELATNEATAILKTREVDTYEVVEITKEIASTYNLTL